MIHKFTRFLIGLPHTLQPTSLSARCKWSTRISSRRNRATTSWASSAYSWNASRTTSGTWLSLTCFASYPPSLSALSHSTPLSRDASIKWTLLRWRRNCSAHVISSSSTTQPALYVCNVLSIIIHVRFSYHALSFLTLYLLSHCHALCRYLHFCLLSTYRLYVHVVVI